MTDRIYVTYTPTTAPGTFHTAIHFERSSPAGEVKHYVVEARPENLEKLNALDKGFGVMEEALRSDGGPSRFGKIAARVQELRPGEYDPNDPYEPVAEGDDLGEQFARMHLFALGVNDAGFPYRGDHQNSNTFASAALKAAGLPYPTGVAHDPAGPNGELLEYFAPGLNEPLGARMGANWSNSRPASRALPTAMSPSPPEQADRSELRVPPLAGLNPENPTQPGLPPLNDGLRDFYRNDPAWLLQIRR